MPRPPLTITVAAQPASGLVGRHARLAPPLRNIVCIALRLEDRRPGDLAIVLSDDTLLRELNRRWRGLDRSTDVLSFPYAEDGQGPVAGDVVISMDRTRDQAKRFRVSVGRELARLVVHGSLHLAGLDHHAAEDRRYMRACEAEALREAKESIAWLERATDTRRS